MRERTADRLDRLERDLYELKYQVMQAALGVQGPFGIGGPIQGKRYAEPTIIDDPMPTTWPPTDEEKARLKAWIDEEMAKR